MSALMRPSGVGIETIKAQIAVSRRLGIVPMVRVPGCHYHLIAPVPDAGAMGIMVPVVSISAGSAISI
jgi:2-keto-3-deoxy-L-rhamnonate aldolase RhmA